MRPEGLEDREDTEKANSVEKPMQPAPALCRGTSCATILLATSRQGAQKLFATWARTRATPCTRSEAAASQREANAHLSMLPLM